MNIEYPLAREEKFSEKINGIEVADPYRWLENADSEETKGWINKQNDLTSVSLKSPAFKTFEDKLIRDFKVATFSSPQPKKGRYFYFERHPDEDQDVLYVKFSLDGEPIKLVDTNGMNKNNTVAIDFMSASRTGRYIAYGLSEGGTETATLYVKDVDKQLDLPDAIVNCRHSAIRWLPDDSGFFYTRNPRPNTVPKGEEVLYPKVYFHKLGADPDTDEMIFGKDRPKDDMLGLSLSIDGNYLGISASQDWVKNDIYIFDRAHKKTAPIVKGINAKFTLSFIKDKALIVTNYKAANYRVLVAPIDKLFTPIDEWEVLIPEKDYTLEYIGATSEKILANYLENVCSRVVVFDYNGREQGALPLPPYSSLVGMSTNREEQEFFYGVTSFTLTKTVYRYDPGTDKYQQYRQIDNPLNPSDYVVKQEWCVSKDGTRVPMFIVHKKSVRQDGKVPTILYGYGGFSNSEIPEFSRGWVPWLERGGVFVTANIRGGGEFGTKWHEQGIKENKQNSFDDFIAAAEYLIAQRYTDHDHLGILGGSNGGLLVSAVAMQCPDLFKAVCARVPLTDMVRFPKFGMAMRWTHEYGNPEIKEDFGRIIKWSPYHNVRSGIDYPNFLFTTGVKDTRVDPLHTRKMVARLQAVAGKNDVLAFTDMDAGHGSGRPISKIVEIQAYILSFFAVYLQLK